MVDIRKIGNTIKRYERALHNEYQQFGCYDDGAGKRLLLGPMYLLTGDLVSCLDYYDWYEITFPDDSADPLNYLCWALALHRAGREKDAKIKLSRAMLSNLYLLPLLWGENRDDVPISPWSNIESRQWALNYDDQYFQIWSDEEISWAKKLYESDGFQSLIDNFIEIETELQDLEPGVRRNHLCDQLSELRRCGISAKEP